MNKNNTADADIYERAREFVDNENPFVKGRPEIVMRRHWLLEFMIGFAKSELARAGRSDGDIRDEVLENATEIQLEDESGFFLNLSKCEDGKWRTSMAHIWKNAESQGYMQHGFASIEEAYRWIMEVNK